MTLVELVESLKCGCEADPAANINTLARWADLGRRIRPGERRKVANTPFFCRHQTEERE